MKSNILNLSLLDSDAYQDQIKQGREQRLSMQQELDQLRGIPLFIAFYFNTSPLFVQYKSANNVMLQIPMLNL